jgi:hypothetical protein
VVGRTGVTELRQEQSMAMITVEWRAAYDGMWQDIIMCMHSTILHHSHHAVHRFATWWFDLITGELDLRDGM